MEDRTRDVNLSAQISAQKRADAYLKSVKLDDAEAQAVTQCDVVVLDARTQSLFDQIEDASDLVKVEFPPLTEFVRSYIVAGLTLLVGKPKKGKSYLVYDMALGIAGGGYALGCLKCMKSEVLYLALEDSRRRLKERALSLTRDGTTPRGCKVTTRWSRGAEGVKALEIYLTMNPACRVVFIDVHTRFKGETNGNGSVYETDYGSLEPLQELAVRHDVAIVMVHHARKADADDMIDLASGTLGLTGAADHIIALRAGAETTPDRLEITGRDLPAKCLDIDLRDGQWIVRGDTEKKKLGGKLSLVNRIDRDNEIRELRAKGMTQHEIAKQMDVSSSTVNAALKRGNGVSYDDDA